MAVDRNTVQDIQQTRHLAHAYLDQLRADQLAAVRGLLESMLSPLDRTLALAPIDDEPVPDGERAAIQAGLDSLARDGGVSMEDVLADFGLTRTDLDRMAEDPSEPDGHG